MKLIKLLKSFIDRIFSASSLTPKQKGERGEKLACSLLRKKGFSILEQGWRWHRFELDIIARKQNMLIFVEVKTRKSKDFGPPELAVNKQKRLHISKAAKAYIKQKNQERRLVRFDIVSVIMSENKKPEIKHIENAFEARF